MRLRIITVVIATTCRFGVWANKDTTLRRNTYIYTFLFIQRLLLIRFVYFRYFNEHAKPSGIHILQFGVNVPFKFDI